MNNFFSTLRTTGLMLALAAGASSTQAYLLNDTGSCHPGQKWDTSHPVKVRLLVDSFTDYLNQRGGSSTSDRAALDKDINAVIALNNAIPGNALVLELGTDIKGDSNLQSPTQDDFGTQTIVIGFTDDKPSDGSSAEAWTNGDPGDGCTRTSAHIAFRKTYDWIFGPPDSLDFASGQFGRSFYTASQPNNGSRNGSPRTFLGILTHEMGHAIGLKHPDDSYAVMAQAFRTWFRAKDGLVTRYLPDDTAGILALYGIAGAIKPLDISVSNSWYKSDASQFSTQCAAEIANVNAAAQAASAATGLDVGPNFPASGIFKGDFAQYFETLASAQNARQKCEDALNAMQVDNCSVSSRADDWTSTLSGEALCGVNTTTSYAPVSSKVCPGTQVQLRFALNNHTTARDVLVKTEAWFTTGTELNAYDGSALQSPDIREITIDPARSALHDRVFRLPAGARVGDKYHVFVRAIPYDPVTGGSLWDTDVDHWNNAIMMNGVITVDAGVCR